MTTRGLGPDDFRAVVGLVDRVLSSPDAEGERAAVRREVHALCEAFPLYRPEDVGLAA
jgi:glycine hydroxymethyltransferase